MRSLRGSHGLPTKCREVDLWTYADGITLDFSRPRQADRQYVRGKLQRQGLGSSFSAATGSWL
jgi:hypothetical protein